ncbi:MAG: DUF1007 family protein [Azospirillaceae bacterium]
MNTPALAMAASAVLAALAFSSAPAGAHPHAWVDQETAAVFGADGRIERVRVSWHFDEAYTAFIVQDTDADGDGAADSDALARMAEETLQRLAEFGYFAEAWADEAEIGWSSAIDPAAAVTEDRLRLDFTLVLARPVDPVAESFVYAVFDPTYWIEMRHPDAAAATVENAPEGAGCETRLDVPDPDEEWVALASLLDSTQTAGDDLGIHFADRVAVTCDAS